jgi:hypothetical protein
MDLSTPPSTKVHEWRKNEEYPSIPKPGACALSSASSAAQAAKFRATFFALDSNHNGRAVLKNVGLTGFREAPSQQFLDFLKWLGDLEVDKRLVKHKFRCCLPAVL